MGVQFITQMDGERHARIRRLLMPAFSSRRLAQLDARITEISSIGSDGIKTIWL
jgi:cytochrome P450